MVPSALCFLALGHLAEELSDVTGHVTYSGKPLHGLTLCLDSTPGIHCAFATLRADGSFRLLSMTCNDVGANPGRYHVTFSANHTAHRFRPSIAIPGLRAWRSTSPRIGVSSASICTEPRLPSRPSHGHFRSVPIVLLTPHSSAAPGRRPDTCPLRSTLCPAGGRHRRVNNYAAWLDRPRCRLLSAAKRLPSPTATH